MVLRIRKVRKRCEREWMVKGVRESSGGNGARGRCEGLVEQESVEREYEGDGRSETSGVTECGNMRRGHDEGREGAG